MDKSIIFSNMEKLYEDSPLFPIQNGDKYVIFSDIHLGNGNGRDDFLQNSSVFNYILERYYLEGGYKLILNGDIEDLYKFKLSKIIRTWRSFYHILNKFNSRGDLIKILGNHDWELQHKKRPEVNSRLYQGVRLEYKSNTIFVFHGHQTSNYLETYNPFSIFMVRYIIRALGIKNPSMPIDSKRISQTEIRSYEFSCRKKIISIIGHTHKPLFESMSRKDTLLYTIENLIRKYPYFEPEKRKKIERNIRKLKIELESLDKDKYQATKIRGNLFNDDLLVPTLFNSGAVIGKRGITGIEIANGRISLIYWFDINRSQRYLKYKGVNTEYLEGTHYYKATLKKDSLDYIFNRIKLLA